jgi:hypothetical protein
MDNIEKLTTLDTQDTGRSQTKQKQKTHTTLRRQTPITNNWGVKMSRTSFYAEIVTDINTRNCERKTHNRTT